MPSRALMQVTVAGVLAQAPQWQQPATERGAEPSMEQHQAAPAAALAAQQQTPGPADAAPPDAPPGVSPRAGDAGAQPMLAAHD